MMALETACYFSPILRAIVINASRPFRHTNVNKLGQKLSIFGTAELGDSFAKSGDVSSNAGIS
jgi:hypothetical protein